MTKLRFTGLFYALCAVCIFCLLFITLNAHFNICSLFAFIIMYISEDTQDNFSSFLPIDDFRKNGFGTYPALSRIWVPYSRARARHRRARIRDPREALLLIAAFFRLPPASGQVPLPSPWSPFPPHFHKTHRIPPHSKA